MIKFLHIHEDPNAKGKFTVAYRLVDPDTNTWEINFAQCSKRDIYNKKRGRQIAGGRLEKRGPYMQYKGSRHELIAEMFRMAEEGEFCHV